MADNIHATGFSSSTYTPEVNLYGGDEDHFERVVTLITGQNLVRGTLLGQITASGKYTLALSASSDGSQTPRAVLKHDCDATSADTECVVIEQGTINELAVTLGTGITLTAAAREALRGLGLHFRQNLRAQ
jgi:hypothetical protein